MDTKMIGKILIALFSIPCLLFTVSCADDTKEPTVNKSMPVSDTVETPSNESKSAVLSLIKEGIGKTENYVIDFCDCEGGISLFTVSNLEKRQDDFGYCPTDRLVLVDIAKGKKESSIELEKKNFCPSAVLYNNAVFALTTAISDDYSNIDWKLVKTDNNGSAVIYEFKTPFSYISPQVKIFDNGKKLVLIYILDKNKIGLSVLSTDGDIKYENREIETNGNIKEFGFAELDSRFCLFASEGTGGLLFMVDKDGKVECKESEYDRLLGTINGYLVFAKDNRTENGIIKDSEIFAVEDGKEAFSKYLSNYYHAENVLSVGEKYILCKQQSKGALIKIGIDGETFTVLRAKNDVAYLDNSFMLDNNTVILADEKILSVDEIEFE